MSEGSISVQLYQTATVTTDAMGNAQLKFGPPRVNRIWQGTVQVLNSPQGTQWTVAVGLQQFGYLFAPGPAGPFQLLNGQTLTLTTTGLTPGDTYTAVLSGVDDPSENPSPYTGPTIVTSVSGVP